MRSIHVVVSIATPASAPEEFESHPELRAHPHVDREVGRGVHCLHSVAERAYAVVDVSVAASFTETRLDHRANDHCRDREETDDKHGGYGDHHLDDSLVPGHTVVFVIAAACRGSSLAPLAVVLEINHQDDGEDCHRHHGHVAVEVVESKDHGFDFCSVGGEYDAKKGSVPAGVKLPVSKDHGEYRRSATKYKDKDGGDDKESAPGSYDDLDLEWHGNTQTSFHGDVRRNQTSDPREADVGPARC